MAEIYDAVIKAHPTSTGKSGIHNSRRTMFKKAVLDSATGPYLATKTHIGSETDVLLQSAEPGL
jgi:hypothetical protein